AGAHFADGVVRVGDADGKLTFTNTFGHLLVSRNDLDAVVLQATIELLGFFGAQDLEQAGRLSCRGAKIRLGHDDLAFPARVGEIQQASRTVLRLRKNLGVY